MPQYASIHRAPGLSQEEFMQNAEDVLKGTHATMVSVAVNIFEGFIVTHYEAADEQSLVKEFERLGFPYDEIHEVQMNITREQLAGMAGG